MGDRSNQPLAPYATGSSLVNADEAVDESSGSASYEVILPSIAPPSIAQASYRHHFENVNASDNARLHAGDVYNVNNYHGRMSRQESILASLAFDGMHNYIARDLDSYPDTYGWIFDEEKTIFKTWLRSSDEIFWISGKAGSGKSTLMKFVSEHQQTREILRKWAGMDVVIASFFAWNAGTELEKSQEGLLRSLLYQILAEQQDLIPQVLPARWKTRDLQLQHTKPWTRKELSGALEALAGSPGLKVRFCFFIDGLDEFIGDHYNLVQDLKQLNTSPAFKLCASSRPWNIFTTALGSTGRYQFALHNLTAGDIDKYIRGQLEADDRFISLSERDSSLSSLVKDIRNRAEGVFLWVKLAVADLRRGLGERDSVKTLRERLALFPTEMEEFLQRILDSIDPIYQKYAARALLLALKTYMIRGALYWSFLEEENSDPDFALHATTHAIEEDEVIQRVKSTETSISKWCKDLLMVTGEPRNYQWDKVPWRREEKARARAKYGAAWMDPRWSYGQIQDVQLRFTVRFPHRTIADFIRRKSYDGILVTMAGTAFQPLKTLYHVSLRLTKGGSTYYDLTVLIPQTLIFGALLEDHLQQPLNFLVEELDHAIQSVFPENDSGYWMELADQLSFPNRRNMLPKYPEESGRPCYIMLFLVHFRLYRTFEAQFATCKLSFPREWDSIFLDCCFALCWTSSSLSLKMIAEILQRGASLNDPVNRRGSHHYSIWQAYLANSVELAMCYSIRLWDIFSQEVQDGLSLGADPNAEVDGVEIASWDLGRDDGFRQSGKGVIAVEDPTRIPAYQLCEAAAAYLAERSGRRTISDDLGCSSDIVNSHELFKAAAILRKASEAQQAARCTEQSDPASKARPRKRARIC